MSETRPPYGYHETDGEDAAELVELEILAHGMNAILLMPAIDLGRPLPTVPARYYAYRGGKCLGGADTREEAERVLGRGDVTTEDKLVRARGFHTRMVMVLYECLDLQTRLREGNVADLPFGTAVNVAASQLVDQADRLCGAILDVLAALNQLQRLEQEHQQRMLTVVPESNRAD